MAQRRGGLVWNRDFRWLWGGDTISQLGSEITVIALPLVAVNVLDASTFAVGVLVAATRGAFLFLGLPAGAWVDRVRRRPVMIVSDVGRALLLAAVPVAALTGTLSLPLLYLVALLAGVCTVFFDVAYMSYLPALVEPAELVEGNAKLQASASVAQVAGPSLGGLLVHAFTAPYAMAADAVSFALSAGSLTAIRTREPPPPRHVSARLREEIREGLRFVLGHPVLRSITGCTGTFNFFSQAVHAIIIVFLVRTVGVSAGVIGALFSAGSAGAIVGALTASTFARRLGPARAIWLPMACTSPLALLLPLTTPGPGLILFSVGWFGTSFGVVVYNINQVAYRQAMCPPQMLGRMNATIRFLVWGTMPLGALAGGALGSAIGNRQALWFALIGEVASTIWLLASPLRTARSLPTHH